MLKTVARLWGVAENEIETNFDPLILLMMEACAAELEKLGYDLSASQSRMLDRLADLLIPEASMSVKPASCIAQATPVEPAVKMDLLTRFYTTQQIQQVDTKATSKLDVFFTPVGEFPLFKVKLAYLFCGSRFYRVNDNNSKELIFETSGLASNGDEIWFAISADKGVQNLNGMSLFFDMRGHSEASAFYNSLHHALAFTGDNEMPLQPGYADKQQFDLNPTEMLVAGLDYSKKINRQIAGIYQKHFIHLAGNQSVASMGAGSVPDSWKHQLPQKVADQLAAESLIFIKLKLNRPFRQDALDTLVCGINAFPVVNRKFNTINYRTDELVNIVPVQVEGSFLDLQDITAANGNKYKFRTTAEGQDLQKGDALVRSTGVGKTSSREVREIIGSLMDAIRDESAYFTELSNEFIMTRFKEIGQILARLEDQVSRAKDNEPARHYILLRPQNAGETVYINYWTTNGQVANQVRSGTLLQPYNHTLVDAKTTGLLTNAVGGKATITEAEKKYVLRQQIASNGKIISAEDVKLVCMQIFGDKLKTVDVKKAIQVGTGAGEGFIRTIDVLLTMAPQVKETMQNEVDYLCSELEYTLENNATMVYPFRVVVL